MKLYVCLASTLAISCLATAGQTQPQKITPDSTPSSSVTLSGNIFTHLGSTDQVGIISAPPTVVIQDGRRINMRSEKFDKDRINLLPRTNCIPGYNCKGDPFYKGS